MKKVKIRSEDNELFFFDFETRVDENNLMVPFYCVIQKVCKKCENIPFKKGEKNEVECCFFVSVNLFLKNQLGVNLLSINYANL